MPTNCKLLKWIMIYTSMKRNTILKYEMAVEHVVIRNDLQDILLSDKKKVPKMFSGWQEKGNAKKRKRRYMYKSTFISMSVFFWSYAQETGYIEFFWGVNIGTWYERWKQDFLFKWTPMIEFD